MPARVACRGVGTRGRLNLGLRIFACGGNRSPPQRSQGERSGRQPGPRQQQQQQQRQQQRQQEPGGARLTPAARGPRGEARAPQLPPRRAHRPAAPAHKGGGSRRGLVHPGVRTPLPPFSSPGDANGRAGRGPGTPGALAPHPHPPAGRGSGLLADDVVAAAPQCVSGPGPSCRPSSLLAPSRGEELMLLSPPPPKPGLMDARECRIA
ncbi:translation initiation factor IF-2-like [Acinonyx jubatus]|uniref:Translation initiation factor IF-2-like n=1 Tax=Acinonyx jubatus TaxID=32536 RepID=A0ABM3Q5Y6_ACIJB|nr:translation initiation factor IF-2-like [Acinonyx jubatus]